MKFSAAKSVPFVEQEDAEIEVYYLEAPLLKQTFGNFLAAFNAFHVGLGFKNCATKKECAIDFCGEHGLGAAVIPTLNGDEAVWNNGSVIYFYDGIDTEYWSKQQKIGKISGYYFNKLMKYAVEEYGSAVTSYYMFSVFKNLHPEKKEPEMQDMEQLISSKTCYDFAWSCLHFLLELKKGEQQQDHGVLEIAEKQSRDIIYFVVDSDPLDVTNDEEEKANVIGFYQALAQLASVGSSQQLKEEWTALVDRSKNGFYYYYQQKYYKLQLSYPYFRFSYSEMSL